MMGSQEQTMMNTVNNCKASFIVGHSKRTPKVSKRQASARKRRAFIIDSFLRLILFYCCTARFSEMFEYLEFINRYSFILQVYG